MWLSYLHWCVNPVGRERRDGALRGSRFCLRVATVSTECGQPGEVGHELRCLPGCADGRSRRLPPPVLPLPLCLCPDSRELPVEFGPLCPLGMHAHLRPLPEDPFSLRPRLCQLHDRAERRPLRRSRHVPAHRWTGWIVAAKWDPAADGRVTGGLAPEDRACWLSSEGWIPAAARRSRILSSLRLLRSSGPRVPAAPAVSVVPPERPPMIFVRVVGGRQLASPARSPPGAPLGPARSDPA